MLIIKTNYESPSKISLPSSTLNKPRTVVSYRRLRHSHAIRFYMQKYLFPIYTVLAVVCLPTCRPFSFPHIIRPAVSSHSTQWMECLKIISFKRYLQLEECEWEVGRSKNENHKSEWAGILISAWNERNHFQRLCRLQQESEQEESETKF